MKRFEGFMKGVNLGGWLSQCVSYEKEHFDTFITEEDIRQIAGWGLDHVRVPVDYNIIENEDGSCKEEGYAYIDNCIRWCKNHGLHMVLDLHKTYGYSFDPLDHGNLEEFFSNEKQQERFIKLWKEIAGRYGSYSDTVAFELLNEIVSPSVADAWNGIANRTIAAIRESAKDSYVIYGGVRYNNVTSVKLLAKPYDDKVVYNFHFYEPLVFTHQKAYWVEGMTPDFEIGYPDTKDVYAEKSDMLKQDLAGALNEFSLERVDRGFMDAMIAPAVQAAEKNDAYLYCGEYGVIDQAPLPDTLRYFEDIHATFEKYGIGRACWNYKQKDFGLVDAHYQEILPDLIKNL